MKENQPVFSLESIDFLFRRFALVISSFVIIMSITLSYLTNVPPKYKCEAIISFEPAGGEVLGGAYLQKKDSVLESLLLGENARLIMTKIWPDLKEEKNTLQYNKRLEGLRGGLRMERPRNQPNLLNVSFVSENPDLCLKAVRVTVDTIISLSKRITEKDIETKLTFLEKQLDFYKKKLSDIDREIIEIQSNLKNGFPDMSPEDRSLVMQVMRGPGLEEGSGAAEDKIKNYDTMITELNLQLLEAEKQKTMLEKRLKSGKFLIGPSSAFDFENDVYVQEYNKAIAAKRLEIAEFRSKGYMPLHPMLKKLEQEIGDLETLKKQHVEDLEKSIDPKASEKAKLEAEENLKRQLEQAEIEIETLKEKIAYMQKNKEGAEEEISSVRTRASAISEEVAKLIDLQNEKTISYKYYIDLKQKLEEEKIRGRIEEEQAGFVIRIIEPPEKPLKPVPFQKIPQLLMGLLLALGTGGGLAYIVDSLDNSVRSSSELRELLGIPVLGTIDHIGTLTEIGLKRVRRTVFVVALLLFAVLSKFLVKLFMSFVLGR